MVTPEGFELVMSTIAIVFEPADEIPGISEEGLRNVLRAPINVAQSAEGNQISSQRDQIEIRIANGRIDVRDHSGDPDRAQEKIPRILNAFIGFYARPLKVKSYGVNFILDVPRESPETWLATRVLQPELSHDLGDSVDCRGVILSLPRHSKQWTLKFDTRPNARLIVDLNAHESITELPDSGQLATELHDQYGGLLTLLRSLTLLPEGA